MISSVDIEAWREDEKQTEFNRREAVNHVGWEVQMLDRAGWRRLGPVECDKAVAMKHLSNWQKFWTEYEFRVYETVREK